MEKKEEFKKKRMKGKEGKKKKQKLDLMTIICDAKDPDLLREAGMLCFHQPSFNVSGLFSELHTKLSAGQTEAGDGIKRHQWVLDRAWTAAARLGRARSQA